MRHRLPRGAVVDGRAAQRHQQVAVSLFEERRQHRAREQESGAQVEVELGFEDAGFKLPEFRAAGVAADRVHDGVNAGLAGENLLHQVGDGCFAGHVDRVAVERRGERAGSGLQFGELVSRR